MLLLPILLYQDAFFMAISKAKNFIVFSTILIDTSKMKVYNNIKIICGEDRYGNATALGGHLDRKQQN